MKLFEKKLNEIRLALEKSTNPIIFFDVDTDGSLSYIQLKKEFPQLIGFPLDKDLKKQKKVIEKYLVFSDLILIFDIPFLHEEFLDFFKDKQIIWVDHHPTNQKDLIERYNILHFNPLNYNLNDNRPACYWAYLLSKNINNLPFAVVGSISDFFLLNEISELFLNYSDLVKLFFPIKGNKLKEILFFIKKYSFNDKRVRKQREDLIRFLIYETTVSVLKNFFDFICKFEDYGDSLKAFKRIEKLSLVEILNKIKENKKFPFVEYNNLMLEYNKRLNIAKQSKEYFFNFYSYVGEISFAKTLSEELMYYFNNTKIMVVCFKKPNKEWYSCSMRSRGLVINTIVSDILKDLNGRGGGHPFAVGCSVNLNDYDKFKKRIFDRFEKLISN